MVSARLVNLLPLPSTFNMLPRIVTTTDVNFFDSPQLGLASLMLEAGYVDAEPFVDYFKAFFESRSVYSFLHCYAYLTPPAVSSCLYMFFKLLGDLNVDNWQATLLRLAPQYTSGFSEVYNIIQAATIDNYKTVLDWFDYPFITIPSIIADPFSAARWAQSIDSTLTTINQPLLSADISTFFVKVLLQKTGIDAAVNVEYYTLLRRWVNLSFTRYAYGADVNQIRWF